MLAVFLLPKAQPGRGHGQMLAVGGSRCGNRLSRRPWVLRGSSSRQSWEIPRSLFFP